MEKGDWWLAFTPTEDKKDFNFLGFGGKEFEVCGYITKDGRRKWVCGKKLLDNKLLNEQQWHSIINNNTWTGGGITWPITKTGGWNRAERMTHHFMTYLFRRLDIWGIDGNYQVIGYGDVEETERGYYPTVKIIFVHIKGEITRNKDFQNSSIINYVGASPEFLEETIGWWMQPTDEGEEYEYYTRKPERMDEKGDLNYMVNPEEFMDD